MRPLAPLLLSCSALAFEFGLVDGVSMSLLFSVWYGGAVGRKGGRLSHQWNITLAQGLPWQEHASEWTSPRRHLEQVDWGNGARGAAWAMGEAG
eukprot:413098-Alexandrium_andersonii.AAC.1